MKTLHLNLKKKWFDMILSGEKPEEYREIKPFWIQRLTFNDIELSDGDINFALCALRDGYSEERVIDVYGLHIRKFDTITFSNGYSKNRPQFVIEFKGIEIREGRPEWGAEPGVRYFVLKLGNIIKC